MQQHSLKLARSLRSGHGYQRVSDYRFMSLDGLAMHALFDLLKTYMLTSCVFSEVLVGSAAPARPSFIKIRKYKDAQPIKMASSYEETQLDFPIQGTGLNWEADAVARCIKGESTSKKTR